MGIFREGRRIVHRGQPDHQEGREQGDKELEQDGKKYGPFIQEPTELLLCDDGEMVTLHPSHPRMK